MTYGMLQSLTTGILTGDNVLPADPDVLQSLVKYSLDTVATQADSLHLMTLSTTANVLRLAQGDYLIRVPDAPVTITAAVDALDLTGLTPEEIEAATLAAQLEDAAATTAQVIDIDEELAPAVSRYVASYLSRDKGGIHVNAAKRIILDYNSKTYEIIDQMELEAIEEGLLALEYEPESVWLP